MTLSIPKIVRAHGQHVLKGVYDFLDTQMAAVAAAVNAGGGGAVVPNPTALGQILMSDGTGIGTLHPPYSWAISGLHTGTLVQISQADLIGNVSQYFTCESGFLTKGSVEQIVAVVQSTVTTGGTIKLTNISNAQDVTGIHVTISNGDTPGTRYFSVATRDTTADLNLFDVLALELSGFASAGRVNVLVVTSPTPVETFT